MRVDNTRYPVEGNKQAANSQIQNSRIHFLGFENCIIFDNLAYQLQFGANKPATCLLEIGNYLRGVV